MQTHIAPEAPDKKSQTKLKPNFNKKLVNAWLRAIFHAAVALIAGLDSNITGMAFLAPGYIVGCWLSKNDYPAAFLGALAGALIAGGKRTLFSLLVLSVLFVVWSLWQGAAKIIKRDRYLMLAAALLVTVAILDTGAPETIFIGLFESVAAIFSAWAVHKGLTGVKSAMLRDTALKITEKIGVCLLLALVGILSSGIRVEGVMALGGVYAILLGGAALESGSGRSVLIAMIGTVGAYITSGLGNGIMACGIIGLGAALPLLINVNERIRFIKKTAYAVLVCLLGYVVTGIFTPIEALAGGILVFLIPKKISKTLTRGIKTTEQTDDTTSKERYEITTEVLRLAGKEIEGLYDSLDGREQERMYSARQRISDVEDAIGRGLCGDGNENTVSDIEQTTQKDENGRRRLKRRLNVITGHAEEAERTEDISGDSVYTQIGEGEAVIILSDGMGTGELAHEESSGFIELYMKLKNAGFEAGAAIECANRLMLERDKESAFEFNERYATADILIIDRKTGEASILKQGAPPSFVVRGSRIITIYGEALPLGILEEAHAYIHKIALESGDWVVMLTDGASDALGGHLIATVTEVLNRTDDAQAAALELLEAAKEQAYEPRDDMTTMFVHVG